MPKMIQVRDVPDSVHSVLKARAAKEGMTLSDFLKRELRQIAERPSMLDWLSQVRQLRPIATRKSSAEIIRQMRDQR